MCTLLLLCCRHPSVHAHVLHADSTTAALSSEQKVCFWLAAGALAPGWWAQISFCSLALAWSQVHVSQTTQVSVLHLTPLLPSFALPCSGTEEKGITRRSGAGVCRLHRWHHQRRGERRRAGQLSCNALFSVHPGLSAACLTSVSLGVAAALEWHMPLARSTSKQKTTYLCTTAATLIGCTLHTVHFAPSGSTP